jgi:hypothetical protein
MKAHERADCAVSKALDCTTRAFIGLYVQNEFKDSARHRTAQSVRSSAFIVKNAF